MTVAAWIGAQFDMVAPPMKVHGARRTFLIKHHLAARGAVARRIKHIMSRATIFRHIYEKRRIILRSKPSQNRTLKISPSFFLRQRHRRAQ